MAKMMMGQIDHARVRVRAIKSKLIGKSPDAKRKFSISDMVKAIRQGTLVFTGPQLQRFAQEWADQYSEELNKYNRISFESVALNSAFLAERADEDERWERENGVYQALANKVNEEATKVEDAIVLGDNAAALIALQAFAAFRP